MGKATMCCSYKLSVTTLEKSFGFDCIQIPGAMKTNGAVAVSEICGGSGLALKTTGALTMMQSVCSKYNMQQIK